MTRDDRLLPESGEDDALFRSAEEALRFALRVHSRSPQRDTLGALRAVPGRGDGLSRADAPGQAGMILAAVWRMPALDLSLLVLRLGTRVVPCTCRRACCSGWATDALWNAARSIVVDAIAEAFAGCAQHYRLRDTLVRRWAGQKVNLGALADSVGVHRNTIGTHGKTAHHWLQLHFRRALADAETALRGDALTVAA